MATNMFNWPVYVGFACGITYMVQWWRMWTSMRDPNFYKYLETPPPKLPRAGDGGVVHE